MMMINSIEKAVIIPSRYPGDLAAVSCVSSRGGEARKLKFQFNDDNIFIVKIHIISYDFEIRQLQANLLKKEKE